MCKRFVNVTENYYKEFNLDTTVCFFLLPNFYLCNFISKKAIFFLVILIFYLLLILNFD